MARRLGVSVATVRRFEARGELTPVRGLDGWAVYFAGDEVDALAAKFGKRPRRARRDSHSSKVSGRTAAKVFELVRAGRSFGDIVIETGLSPDVVRAAERELRLGFEGLERERAQQRSRAETRRQQREYERKCAKEDALDRTLETRLKVARIVASGTAPVIVEGPRDPKLAGAALALSIAEMSRAMGKVDP